MHMHPTIEYELVKERIADLRRQAERDAIPHADRPGTTPLWHSLVIALACRVRTLLPARPTTDACTCV